MEPSASCRSSKSSSSSSSISEPLRCSRAPIVLLGVLLVASWAILVCHADEANKEPPLDQDPPLSEQPNRQFFKMHLISGSKSIGGAGKKLFPTKRKAAARLHQADESLDSFDLLKSTATAAADGDESIKGEKSNSNSNNKAQERQPIGRGQKGTGATISSATLKRLLNQTLLKSASNNATDLATSSSQQANNSGQKTSKNFKFVFIQRATAAPPAKLSSTTASPAPTGAKEQSSSSPESASKSSSSLAASVSKQLAASLLNSAAGLVANLGSSPSLSSLASQIVAASADAANSIGDTILNSATTTTASRQRNNSTADNSLLAAAADSSGAAETTGSRQQPSGGSNETGATKKATNKKGTKSKPAKIYNLPVKFVANGQPNHVAVFHTLKEHFATIKRLQAMSVSSGNGGTKTAGSIRPSNKERMHPQQQKQRQRHKLKGTNSRLIYLPLRYLSNAKPNKIMITGSSSSSSSKAAHKSAIS